ncbi:Scr1 family TA system antitoxin-like transcriptional regulator [Kitasatospora sp. NPDC094015]|uniref:Scr1 family TA system antitoxin-like transcriptional regulator n=1 Tax=Kitasatospora sp. NPDC094015 TaxID=3155205 RepID=UPI00331D44BB
MAQRRPRTWGGVLESHRKGAGLSQTQVARLVNSHQTTISQLETGKAAPTQWWAEQLDHALQAQGSLVAAYELVAPFLEGSTVPDWFREFAREEAHAKVVHERASGRISGLLQTEEYMRAQFRHYDPAATPEKINEWVAARLGRQAKFFGPDPARLVVLLDKDTLYRQVGGPQVLHRQLGHVLGMARRPNVTVQVLPFSLGELSGSAVTTLIVELPNGHRLAYSESSTRGHLISDPAELRTVLDRYDQVRAHALPVRDSARMIRSVMEGLVNMLPDVDPTNVAWRKSTYSGDNGGACVEWAPDVAAAADVVPVRDSKDPQGPALLLSPGAWAAFTAAAASGAFGQV